ncbi:transposase [Crossiella sp. SN42]|uniref:transposase n=1 Tax=Crossiella sp. SN42 TaxID=2944808 RepID=UPI00207D0C0F|nr:transposase [Crossiella sp. SN42]MCO1582775.1 transposase [Crossiella sp. SN42]
MPHSLPHPAHTTQLHTLQQLRRNLYNSFTAWPDTLFEITDALLASPHRPVSLPWLTLEPPLRRGHGSIYRALRHGRIDTTALTQTLTGLLPAVAEPGMPHVFALDASHWPRPDAATSPERTFNYDATKNRHHDDRPPVTAGWWYQWIAATTWEHTSWALPVDLARIAPGDNHHTLALTQIRALLDRLPTPATPATPATVPIVCLDGDYSIAWIARQLTDLPVQLLGRLRSDGSMFTDPPPHPPGTRGRKPVHGPKMKFSDPTTWPQPDADITVPARPDRGRHHPLTVTAWHRLHPARSRKLPEPHPGRGHYHDLPHGTVIRIHSAQPGQKPMWLFWSGPPGSFDLDIAWRAYLHRFDIEHLYRFLKHHLGWTTPRLRTPEQATCWSWLIAAACAQLVAARDLVTDMRLPWEKPGPLSPLRVKRGLRALQSYLGTPAQDVAKTTPGPGRPSGRTSAPAPRHPVVRKRPRSGKPKPGNKNRTASATKAHPAAQTG